MARYLKNGKYIYTYTNVIKRTYKVVFGSFKIQYNQDYF